MPIRYKQRMDLRHLRTFLTVADQGTVSKAALRLRIAQPALSRQINDLEQELGLRLFDRVGRRLVLTGEGEQLRGDCRSLLGQADSLIERARLLRNGESGVLRVAATPHMIESVLSVFLDRYGEHYPKVEVKFFEAFGPEQLVLLDRGEIHVGLRHLHTDGDHFGSHSLPAVEVVAASHPSLKLGRHGMVEVGRLASHPLLLLESGYSIRRTFDAACRLARLEPNTLLESHSPHTLLALAETGRGVAIIPSLVRIDRYKLQFAWVTHRRKTLRAPFAAQWNKRRTLPRYATGFCELLDKYMHEVCPIARPSVRRETGR
jgi:LysR family transcriptional regulator, nitrogen assimilation regulatory protein